MPWTLDLARCVVADGLRVDVVFVDHLQDLPNVGRGSGSGPGSATAPTGIPSAASRERRAPRGARPSPGSESVCPSRGLCASASLCKWVPSPPNSSPPGGPEPGTGARCRSRSSWTWPSMIRRPVTTGGTGNGSAGSRGPTSTRRQASARSSGSSSPRPRDALPRRTRGSSRSSRSAPSPEAGSSPGSGRGSGRTGSSGSASAWTCPGPPSSSRTSSSTPGLSGGSSAGPRAGGSGGSPGPGGLSEVDLGGDPALPHGLRLPEASKKGARFDAPTGSVDFVEELAALPWTGLFLAFDYGKSWEELATSAPAGTARASTGTARSPTSWPGPESRT